MQLNRLMKERYLISQKLISEQDQILFSDKNFSFATNDYSTPEEFSKFIDNKSPSHLYLHTNISSLSYNIDDLASFVLNSRKWPIIIWISECWIRANQQSQSKISLQNYIYEFISIESSKGGTLIYIDQNVKYKIREDLKLYKSKEIDSTFLEIIKNNQKNVIVGCIYKHPGTAIQEFNNDFICPLLEKLLTEKKEVILMGDYNINILRHNVLKLIFSYN